MTRVTPEALYALLPAIHRLRDADEGGPLAALVDVLAREGAVVEDSIEQLLDDLFIETCAPWAAPYIGGLVGYRTLHAVEGLAAGSRAEIANTIAYRRRKGTAAVLEQLARDVTGWPASAVEYVQRTACCQHMNVARPGAQTTANLRNPLELERLGGAFDKMARSVDVRSIADGRGRRGIGGRHNLPNIGLHLWRLQAMRQSRVPATAVDERRFLFDPLGAPRQLVNRQEAEREITALAGPVNVPGAITRRMLDATPAAWMRGDAPGGLRALDIFVGGTPVPVSDIAACDLSDDGAGWNHVPHPPDPAGSLRPVRVDPVLGRIAFRDPPAGEVRVSFHTAFPGPIGGGEYNRAASLPPPAGTGRLIRFPESGHASLQEALDSIGPEGGIVEITENGIFPAPATIRAPENAGIGLRSADGVRAILRGSDPITISGAARGRVTLNGLVLDGCALEVVPEAGVSLAALDLAHVTLIPGLSLSDQGNPASPGAVSLRVTATGVAIAIARSILGPVRMSDTASLRLEESILDAAAADPADSPAGLAIAGLADNSPAGALTILRATVIGRIRARALPLVSDAILFARPASPGEAPVRAERRQDGCLRFSYVPPGSVVPRRFRCQPQLAIDEAIAARAAAIGGPVPLAERHLIRARILPWLVPGFTALTASAPAYAQLRRSAPPEIRKGASDEGEMGAWHLLHQPQRETNLRLRLDEYLRFGLEAGLIFET
ncbi:hypothetical protein [Rhodovulum strictum]|uniref:Phage tail protein (Tail_P2_I) n=1 Tax=Rhodovulum strictum TaxID=58314 RepID=A0A844BG03_9RHOB|nr:hypothetical protein [Rhodovulum strictum]MRH20012.1 hypothetical protein [Rhodovulum strictum]